MTVKQDSKSSTNARSEQGYLHGYSPVEQERLRHQARFTEQSIYSNIDLSGVDRLLALVPSRRSFCVGFPISRLLVSIKMKPNWRVLANLWHKFHTLKTVMSSSKWMRPAWTLSL
jgi:hypothetical protein